MPKKKSEGQSPIDQLAWLMDLPDSGGAWGKGIIETASALEAEAKAYDAQVEEAVKAANAAKKAANDRRALIMATVKRAEKEAPKLYSDAQIATAKGPVEKAAE